MKVLGVLMMAFLLCSFQDTTKNVLSSDQDTSVIVTDMDSCDFRMDTAYAGHLYREAKVLMDAGEYTHARTRLSAAKESALLSVGYSDTLTAKIICAQGTLSSIIGDLDLAHTQLNEALSIFNSYNFPSKTRVAEAHYSLSLIDYKKGNYQRALTQMMRSYEIFDSQGVKGKEGIVFTLNGLGSIYLSLGDYVNSMEYTNEALQLAMQNDTIDPNIPAYYNNIGHIWLKMGNYDRALENISLGLQYQIELYGDDHPELAVYYNNVGKILANKGIYDKALRFYSKCLSLEVDTYGEINSDVSITHNNIGNLLTKMQKYDAALYHLEKAVSISKTISEEDTHRLAIYFSNLGKLLESEQKFKIALVYYKKSMAIRRSVLGVNHPSIAVVYTGIGRVLLKMGREIEAQEYFIQSIQTLQNTHGERHWKLASNYALIGLANSKLGNHSRSNNNFKKALSLLEYELFSEDYKSVVDLRLLRDVLWMMCDYFKSSESGQKMSCATDSLYFQFLNLIHLDNYLQQELLDNNTKAYYGRKNLPLFERLLERIIEIDDNDCLEEGVSLVQASKGGILMQSIVNSNRVKSFGTADSLIKLERDIKSKILFYEKRYFELENEIPGNMDSLGELYGSRLFSLKNELDNVVDLIKVNQPRYYSLGLKDRLMTINSIQDSVISTNQTLLEYFVGDSFIFTFTVLPDTFYVHQIKKDFPLEQWVENMLHGIYDPYTSGTDTIYRAHTFQQASNNIYQEVFHHVDTLLPRGTDILVVPDGVLGYIPFDALLTDSTNSKSYLIRDHQISYAYSATLQAEMENMQHDEKAKKKVLAFAPSFNQSDVVGDTTYLASRSIDVTNERNWLTPLKYNDDEVRSISEMAGADLFLDSIATKEQFLQHASDYSIIHLSTHGKANDKMGDYSFLAFYDPKDSSETWLYNRELYGLDLNADMVVLSACETGIGELQRGEGIISLARGFSYAGAKSIVTTLWSVNDRSTQKVMELFYENLTQGMRKDAALRQAKLDYLDKHPNLGSAPYFWAGIIPIGDMSPIQFDNGYNYPLWAGFFLVLGGLLWLSFRKKK